ncbi:hypothetical protein BGX31_009415 [Mortierella sp. GBA43]|nr:hypothetical protein BGX31_009415 [Mortierella sp. GBA43]
MEEVTQSFRLNGDTEVLELPCDQDDGHYFIDWDLILDVFPGAQYIKNGKIIVRKLGDTGPDGTSRQRIRHHPGVVLDVVLSSSVPRAPFTPPSGHPNPPVGYQPSDSSETSTDGHDVKNLEYKPTLLRIYVGRSFKQSEMAVNMSIILS